MIEKAGKWVEIFAHIGIILLTIMMGYLLVWLTTNNQNLPDRNQQLSARRTPELGAKISIPGINLDGNKRTMLFVLSNSCKFCKESAPFYRNLVQESQKIQDLHLMAMFPQEVPESERYLRDMGIEIKDVRQGRPTSVGTNGFPTLMLVDKGVLKKFWIGKLSTEKEMEVLARLKCADCN